MTLKTLTTFPLLASFLLLTGCNDNAKTKTNSTTENNVTIEQTTTTAGSSDDNTTTPPTTAPISLKLTIEKSSLNKDENATVKIMATYSDNSIKELNANIEWIITPTDSIDVNGSVLTAKKNGDVAVQAKVGATLSNTLNLNIIWVVNGHVLPPEPDKTLNDSTLFGIDVNDNGVRDDVERWIYEEYKDKHPVYIDIGMQAARGYKLVLEHPERAKEIHGEATAYLDCKSYYSTYAKYFDEPILIKDDSGVSEYFRSEIYFNTSERKASYDQYDKLLGGDSYSLPKIEDLKSLCDFDTSKYVE